MMIYATKENLDLMHKVCSELEKTFEEGAKMTEKKRVTVYIDEEVIKVLDKMAESTQISRSHLITLAAHDLAMKYSKDYSEMVENIQKADF